MDFFDVFVFGPRTFEVIAHTLKVMKLVLLLLQFDLKPTNFLINFIYLFIDNFDLNIAWPFVNNYLGQFSFLVLHTENLVFNVSLDLLDFRLWLDLFPEVFFQLIALWPYVFHAYLLVLLDVSHGSGDWRVIGLVRVVATGFQTR